MLIKPLVLCCQKKSCLHIVFHIIVDPNPTSASLNPLHQPSNRLNNLIFNFTVCVCVTKTTHNVTYQDGFLDGKGDEGMKNARVGTEIMSISVSVLPLCFTLYLIIDQSRPHESQC